MTCTLDSLGQLTLMSSAGTGHAAGQDLAALGHVLLQLAGIFIVNVCNLIYAECAYLATVLNADQYASEEASYKQWVQERDSGAENAAKETEDDTAKQLASYSFKQSYTKTHCYKLLDLMN